MSTIYNYMGWHTLITMQIEGFPLEGQNDAIKYNGITLSSYIPAIGAFIGSCHLWGACVNTKLTISSRVYFVARGFVEIIGAGILFFIPDLLVSLHRHIC